MLQQPYSNNIELLSLFILLGTVFKIIKYFLFNYFGLPKLKYILLHVKIFYTF